MLLVSPKGLLLLPWEIVDLTFRCSDSIRQEWSLQAAMPKQATVDSADGGIDASANLREAILHIKLLLVVQIPGAYLASLVATSRHF